MKTIESVLLSPDQTIREAALTLDRTARGLVIIVDEERRVLGTITDGDIRRAVLAGLALETPAGRLLANKAPFYTRAVTAPVGTEPDALLELMRERSVHQIPLLDAGDRVVDLAVLDELLPAIEQPIQAVVMAGGFGKRLSPLTEETPKPMLKVGDRPLLEHTFEQLRQAGIHSVNVTTHYLPEKISDYFGDGREFGLNIRYVQEDQPLGTAGSLSRVVATEEPILVMNGDILTRVDFRAMLAFHREHRAHLTVGVRQYDFRVPYGVVHCEGASVTRIEEKPEFNFFVNAGIYILDPLAHRDIPENRRFDMTDLIAQLSASGRTVVAFPIIEYWLDVGRHSDYAKAQEDLKELQGKHGA